MLFFLSKGAFGMGIYKLDKKELRILYKMSKLYIYWIQKYFNVKKQ